MRVWRKLSFEKCKLFSGLLTENQSDSEDVDLNTLMEKDNLEAAISSIGKEFPKITEILINERDQHLAYKIKNCTGEKKLLLLLVQLMFQEYKEKYCVNRI